jgi:hypothetical protein
MHAHRPMFRRTRRTVRTAETTVIVVRGGLPIPSTCGEFGRFLPFDGGLYPSAPRIHKNACMEKASTATVYLSVQRQFFVGARPVFSLSDARVLTREWE